MKTTKTTKNLRHTLTVKKSFNWQHLTWKILTLSVITKYYLAPYVSRNNRLFKFRKVESPLCSFCNLNEATTIPNFWQLRTCTKYANHFRSYMHIYIYIYIYIDIICM